MDKEYKKLLEKQGYRFIGEHSAIKTCGWTSASLGGRGVCYKQKFYGINSHRCVQMSVAVNFCNMDCVFCWRERNNSAFDKIDEPVELINNAVEAQKKLLFGFGGNPKTSKKKFEEAKNPIHFAISLNGENTAYPKLSEFISALKKKNYSSFLVTNGQLPEVLEKIEMPTQLYISISAPNKKLFDEINKPMHKNGWERLIKSLKIMKKLKNKTRTTIRLTLINDMTMKPEHAKEYAELIKIAEPLFLEVKSYMWLGASKKRLKLQNMARHEQIREFAKEISKYCDYKIIDESPDSRVVLMMQSDFSERMMRFNI